MQHAIPSEHPALPHRSQRLLLQDSLQAAWHDRPDGGAWETLLATALKAALLVTPAGQLTAYEADIHRIARLVLADYREAVRQEQSR